MDSAAQAQVGHVYPTMSAQAQPQADTAGVCANGVQAVGQPMEKLTIGF